MEISTHEPPSANPFVMEHNAQADQRQQRIQGMEDEITELAAHIHAATFRLLEVLREYDESLGWHGKGLISCAHWLNWKCGIGLGAGREKMRVAHALKELPRISEEFRLGKVSYSKVRAMTRVATPKNEDYLLSIARYGTAVHVERLVRLYRRVKRNEALAQENDHHDHRELHWHIDDEGYWVIRGRLTAEQGALVQSVLEQALEERFSEERDVPAGISTVASDDDYQLQPIAIRRADALVRLAEGYSASAHGPAGDRFLVHVHTDMETLKIDGTGGEAEVEGAGNIAAEAVRRLACDAGVVQWLERNHGEPLSIGRKSRTIPPAIPPAIRRALQRRDRGCRFPGCSNQRFVDAHHIVHWADGGETAVQNLVLMCRHHHRLVHESGYGITRTSEGAIEFRNPCGEIIPTGPCRNSRGNAQSLFKDHLESGIHITPKTAQSQWMGEQMDDDLATLGMLQLE